MTNVESLTLQTKSAPENSQRMSLSSGSGLPPGQSTQGLAVSSGTKNGQERDQHHFRYIDLEAPISSTPQQPGLDGFAKVWEILLLLLSPFVARFLTWLATIAIEDIVRVTSSAIQFLLLATPTILPPILSVTVQRIFYVLNDLVTQAATTLHAAGSAHPGLATISVHLILVLFWWVYVHGRATESRAARERKRSIPRSLPISSSTGQNTDLKPTSDAVTAPLPQVVSPLFTSSSRSTSPSPASPPRSPNSPRPKPRFLSFPLFILSVIGDILSYLYHIGTAIYRPFRRGARMACCCGAGSTLVRAILRAIYHCLRFIVFVPVSLIYYSLVVIAHVISMVMHKRRGPEAVGVDETLGKGAITTPLNRAINSLEQLKTMLSPSDGFPLSLTSFNHGVLESGNTDEHDDLDNMVFHAKLTRAVFTSCYAFMCVSPVHDSPIGIALAGFAVAWCISSRAAFFSVAGYTTVCVYTLTGFALDNFLYTLLATKERTPLRLKLERKRINLEGRTFFNCLLNFWRISEWNKWLSVCLNQWTYFKGDGQTALENALPELSTLKPIDAWPLPLRNEGSRNSNDGDGSVSSPSGGIGGRQAEDDLYSPLRPRERPTIGGLPVPDVLHVNACHVARAVLETRPYQQRTNVVFALHEGFLPWGGIFARIRDISYMLCLVTLFVLITRLMCGVFPMQDPVHVHHVSATSTSPTPPPPDVFTTMPPPPGSPSDSNDRPVTRLQPSNGPSSTSTSTVSMLPPVQSTNPLSSSPVSPFKSAQQSPSSASSEAVGNAIRIAQRGVTALLESRGLVGCPLIRVSKQYTPTPTPSPPKASTYSTSSRTAPPSAAGSATSSSSSSFSSSSWFSWIPSFDPASESATLDHWLTMTDQLYKGLQSSSASTSSSSRSTTFSSSSSLSSTSALFYRDLSRNLVSQTIHAIYFIGRSLSFVSSQFAPVSSSLSHALYIVTRPLFSLLRPTTKRSLLRLCRIMSSLHVPCTLSNGRVVDKLPSTLPTITKNDDTSISVRELSQALILSFKAFITRPSEHTVAFSQFAYPFPPDSALKSDTEAATLHPPEAMTGAHETVFCSAIIIPPALGTALSYVRVFYLGEIQWHSVSPPTLTSSSSLTKDDIPLTTMAPQGEVPVLVVDWFALSLSAQWLMLMYFGFMFYMVQSGLERNSDRYEVFTSLFRKSKAKLLNLPYIKLMYYENIRFYLKLRSILTFQGTPQELLVQTVSSWTLFAFLLQLAYALSSIIRQLIFFILRVYLPREALSSATSLIDNWFTAPLPDYAEYTSATMKSHTNPGFSDPYAFCHFVFHELISLFYQAITPTRSIRFTVLLQSVIVGIALLRVVRLWLRLHDTAREMIPILEQSVVENYVNIPVQRNYLLQTMKIPTSTGIGNNNNNHSHQSEDTRASQGSVISEAVVTEKHSLQGLEKHIESLERLETGASGEDIASTHVESNQRGVNNERIPNRGELEYYYLGSEDRVSLKHLHALHTANHEVKQRRLSLSLESSSSCQPSPSSSNASKSTSNSPTTAVVEDEKDSTVETMADSPSSPWSLPAESDIDSSHVPPINYKRSHSQHSALGGPSPFDSLTPDTNSKLTTPQLMSMAADNLRSSQVLIQSREEITAVERVLGHVLRTTRETPPPTVQIVLFGLPVLSVQLSSGFIKVVITFLLYALVLIYSNK